MMIHSHIPLIVCGAIAIFVTFLVECKPKPKWEPRDTWFGLFHDRIDAVRTYHLNGTFSVSHRFRFYLVIVPCVPLVWDWVIVTKHKTEASADKAVRTKKTLFHILLP